MFQNGAREEFAPLNELCVGGGEFIRLKNRAGQTDGTCLDAGQMFARVCNPSNWSGHVNCLCRWRLVHVFLRYTVKTEQPAAGTAECPEYNVFEICKVCYGSAIRVCVFPMTW